MNRWGWIALAACAAMANAAFANYVPPVPTLPPPPADAAELSLVVRLDPDATFARLILPPEAAGRAKDGSPPSRGDFGTIDWTPWTVLAGVLLSLAGVGIYFVTRLQGAAKLVVVGIVGGSALAGGAVAWANLSPLPSDFFIPDRQPRNQMLDAETILPLQTRVVLERTGSQGSPVTLIVPVYIIQSAPGTEVPAVPSGALPQKAMP